MPNTDEFGDCLGSTFLLKISDGADNPFYAAIAGLRVTQLSIAECNYPIVGDGWYRWLADQQVDVDIPFIAITATGIFVGPTKEMHIRKNKLSCVVDDYELSFESGERLKGKFLVSRLDYTGDFNGERSYTLALESFGPVAVE